MLKGIRFRIIIAALLIFGIGNVVAAQDESALGSLAPYSLFGIGDITKQGSAVNRAMGGIGIGVRDNRYINYLNPASITKRDTLAFMFDFGLYQKNTITTDGNRNIPFNTLNISHITLTAPLYGKTAIIAGVSPISTVGYNFTEVETNLNLINEHGSIGYSQYGSGYVSRLFLGVSTILFKNLSLGIEGNYYFGSIKHHSDISFGGNGTNLTGPNIPRKIETGKDNSVKSLGAKIAMQYEKNFTEEVSLTLGGTWAFNSKLNGDQVSYSYAKNGGSGATDTIRYELYDRGYEMPGELGIGFSIRKRDKWLVGMDYIRQDWTKSKFEDTPGVNFQTTAANSVRLGVEYIPNRYDVRYYLKRATYRGGIYYDQGYMKIRGQQINAMGITLGMTIPIPPLYNAIGISVDMGQRGKLSNNLLRERYVMFNVSISLHEIWFRKIRYD